MVSNSDGAAMSMGGRSLAAKAAVCPLVSAAALVSDAIMNVKDIIRMALLYFLDRNLLFMAQILIFRYASQKFLMPYLRISTK
jgi:hypothetical protein